MIRVYRVGDLFSEEVKFDTESTGREDWDVMLENKEDFDVEIRMLTPDEFLELIDYKRFSFDKTKVDSIANDIKTSTNTILPAPAVVVNKVGSSEFYPFHDGQHRMLALKQLEFTDKVPVNFISDKRTGGGVKI